MTFLEILLIAAVAAPGLLFLVLALAWLVGFSPGEHFLARLTGAVFGFSTISTLIIGAEVLFPGEAAGGRLLVRLGDWFHVGDYEFPIDLLADRLSLPLMSLTAVLTGLIANFASRYLHRERGFVYFFLLLQVFGFGSLLLFAAGSFDLIVAGWELVGWTSVLLIAFFHERQGPVENGLRVFGIYRVCDVGLLAGVVALHHFAGTASLEAFQGFWPEQTTSLTGSPVWIIGLLLLFAAMGKAAQFPFSGWLPRAMEGPTPSSAIFYGAIAVHAGAYLLLRAQPILNASTFVSSMVVLVGFLSAVMGIMIGRACTDIKTSLAYASVAQLGLIFVEIGLGFSYLAVWHICGHAIVRTLQFLRAPSALHEFHQVHAAAGGHLAPVGEHLEAVFPLRIRLWLYRFALDRGHMDTFLDRIVVAPVLAVASQLNPSPDAKRARLRHAPGKTGPRHVQGRKAMEGTLVGQGSGSRMESKVDA